MKNLAIAVNTVSICNDIWEMFFSQLEKHFPNQKIYVFTDVIEGLPDNVIPLQYDPKDSFKTQSFKCLQQINEEYIIYLNEDYILYEDVLTDEIEYCIDFLDDNKEMSFVRFAKGIEYNEPKIADKLYLMDNKNMWFFSQAAGLWRTKDFEKIHEESPESGTAFRVAGLQLELVANETCKELDIKGVFYYNGETKRGIYHYNSTIFPHIATAVIKGKLNLKEYTVELKPLLDKYKIDVNIRGTNI